MYVCVCELQNENWVDAVSTEEAENKGCRCLCERYVYHCDDIQTHSHTSIVSIVDDVVTDDQS